MDGIASKTKRIAVLTSGNSRGSNLRAMIHYFSEQQQTVVVDFVVITKRSAPVAEYCLEMGIRTEFISTKDMHSFETTLSDMVRERGVKLIAMAGFLKKLSSQFLSDVGIPVLNIHPALLPDYGGKGLYGMNVHRAVFADARTKSGATVHLVDSKYDHGEIIAQEVVDVSTCRSVEEIAEAVLQIEHMLYPSTILAFLTSRQ